MFISKHPHMSSASIFGHVSFFCHFIIGMAALIWPVSDKESTRPGSSFLTKELSVDHGPCEVDSRGLTGTKKHGPLSLTRSVAGISPRHTKKNVIRVPRVVNSDLPLALLTLALQELTHRLVRTSNWCRPLRMSTGEIGLPCGHLATRIVLLVAVIDVGGKEGVDELKEIFILWAESKP